MASDRLSRTAGSRRASKLTLRGGSHGPPLLASARHQLGSANTASQRAATRTGRNAGVLGPRRGRLLQQPIRSRSPADLVPERSRLGSRHLPAPETDRRVSRRNENPHGPTSCSEFRTSSCHGTCPRLTLLFSLTYESCATSDSSGRLELDAKRCAPGSTGLAKARIPAAARRAWLYVSTARNRAVFLCVAEIRTGRGSVAAVVSLSRRKAVQPDG